MANGILKEHVKGAIIEGAISGDGRYVAISAVLEGDGSQDHPRTLRAWDADIMERWRRGELGMGQVIVSYEMVPTKSGKGTTATSKPSEWSPRPLSRLRHPRPHSSPHSSPRSRSRPPTR